MRIKNKDYIIEFSNFKKIHGQLISKISAKDIVIIDLNLKKIPLFKKYLNFIGIDVFLFKVVKK